MDRPYSQADFVSLVGAQFPELREELEDADGALHLQMHAFTRALQAAKGAGAWERYHRGMLLAAELWRRPDDAVYGALKVSFLEHLDFDGATGPAAWAYLSPELQEGWRGMQEYWKRLSAKPAKAAKRAPRHRKGKRG